MRLLKFISLALIGLMLALLFRLPAGGDERSPTAIHAGPPTGH